MPATKATKSDKWFVRIDGPEEYLRQKCEELAKSPDTELMLAAYHRGKTKENPHCHFVIQIKSEIQKQSFAVRIKALFNIEKKTQYALDVWDGVRGQGAVSYLFHEEDQVIIANLGFTDKEIMDAKAANEAVQKVVAINSEKASHKLVQRALDEFEMKPYQHRTKIHILTFMLELCKKGECYYPGTFMIKKFVEEVELKMLDNDNLEAYACNLARQLWREENF